MKSVLIAGLLLLTTMAHAGLPACQYDDPSGSGEWELRSYKEPGTLTLPDGGCVLWYCDAVHKWKAEGFCFSAADMTQYSNDLVRSWIGMTKDERNQLWANNVHPAVPGSIDERMIKWRDSLPKPDKAPPSGLVTTDTKVYAVSASTDFNVLSPVGTIALGVKCDVAQTVANSSGRFFVVPISAVTWTGTKRLRVYAKCD